MNCSHNNMTQLPDKLLPNTQQLLLAGNNMRNINHIPEGLIHMEKVDMRDNNLKQISAEALETFMSLSDNLILSDNTLQEVPTVLQANKETQIWLSNNPFLCNCDMMWMRDWLQNVTNVMDKLNITCGEGKWNGEVQKYIYIVRVCVFLFILILTNKSICVDFFFRDCNLPFAEK